MFRGLRRFASARVSPGFLELREAGLLQGFFLGLFPGSCYEFLLGAPFKGSFEEFVLGFCLRGSFKGSFWGSF